MADKKQRLRDIIAAKSVLAGNFTLASGKASGYFYDMKKTMFDPEGASLVGELLCDLLGDDTETKAVGGLEQFQEKRKSVLRRELRKNKNLERLSDSKKR